MEIKNARILVTGGAGFLGQHVIEALLAHGAQAENLSIPRSRTDDLREQSVCEKVVQGMDLVLHLSGKIGGIGFNQKYPAELFYDNLKMGMQLINAAYRYGVEKFVIIGTACEYPEFIPVPFSEDDIWEGYPAKETAPYGLAKKMLLVQAQTYREQYGFNAVQVIPTNLYGPHDNFRLEYSHVIPALIRKVVDAKANGDPHVDVWGSGNATREFMYAGDAAEGIVLAAERYDKPMPVNLGTGVETSIRELVGMISDLLGYDGSIRWDASKPDGTPRRCLDVSRAEKEFGFKAKMDLETGLRKTIDWYQKSYFPYIDRVFQK